MLEREPKPQRDAESDDDAEGIDFERVKEIAGFVLRAPRRRPWLALCTFGLTAAAGVTIAVAMPCTYNAQVKLLAQTNLLVPALSNPGRTVPREADSPTKNVADQILRTDNLIELAKETNLVERYYAQRSPLLKLKDWLLGGSQSDEEKLHSVVETLEKKLFVWTQDNNVTISLDWTDAQMAYTLVTTAQKNFLSARYDDDVAMISDAIAVLKEHSEAAAAEVDTALADYQKVAESLSPTPPGRAAMPLSLVLRAPRRERPAAAHSPTADAVPTASPELAAELQDIQGQIRSLEAERQRELESLRSQLAQAQLTLTPQHPTVIALQQKVDATSAPDLKVAQLKQQARDLVARMTPPPAPSPPPPSSEAPPSTPRQTAAPAPEITMATTYDDAPTSAAMLPATADKDPRAQLARARLEGAGHRYQEAKSSLESANIELEIAHTTFKYRYIVVTPAEVPKHPKRPIRQLVGMGSILGATMLALLLAAAADLWSGRILEVWQVRRRLNLEVLGDFEPVPPVPPDPG